MIGLDPDAPRRNQDSMGKELGVFICNTPQFIGYVAGLEKKPAH